MFLSSATTVHSRRRVVIAFDVSADAAPLAELLREHRDFSANTRPVSPVPPRELDPAIPPKIEPIVLEAL